MTGQQLAALEETLEAADQLRANSKLTATEYSFPVLGLIFLRHAFNRFNDVKIRTESTLPTHPQRGKLYQKMIFLKPKRSFYLTEQDGIV